MLHDDAAQRGKACNCRCLACDEAQIARHGDIKAHSFAHASGAECQLAVDAMLNRLAQELIAAAGVFESGYQDLTQRGRMAPNGLIRVIRPLISDERPVAAYYVEPTVRTARLRRMQEELAESLRTQRAVVRTHRLDGPLG